MAKRMSLILGAFGALLPAAAAAQTHDYRYCRADGQGLSLVRTFRQDRYVFQSTLGGALMPAGEPNLRAYLTWTGSPSSAPELWIANGGAEYVLLPTGARLTFYTTGEDEDATLAVPHPRSNDAVFKVDPERLLARFPRERRLRIGFYSAGGKRLTMRAWLDLDALRAALAEAGRLAPRLDAGAGTCSDTVAGLPEEADPGKNDYCHVELTDPNGIYYADTGSIRWQYRLSADLLLKLDRSIFTSETQQQFDVAVRRSLGEDRYPLLTIFADQWTRNRGWIGKTLDVRGEGGSFSTPVSADTKLGWRKMREIEGTGQVVLVVRGAGGAELARFALPPGLFANAERQLNLMLDSIGEQREAPMERCGPWPQIVVT